MHTTASDGGLSPAACVDEAARAGLAAIGITDHGTLAGNLEALARGRTVGIEVVPGVEVSATHGRWAIHLLGYWPRADAPGLVALLERLRQGREERNAQILERLAARGCTVSPEELAAEAPGEIVGRPHLAALLVRKGHAASFQAAFARLLARGAAAYVPRWKPDAAAAIAALRDAGAVPVLAHPGASGLRSTDEAEALVTQLVTCGLRGLEVYYPAHDPGRTVAFERIARQHGLVATGGTDFHGATKPDIRMGCGTGTLHVAYPLLERLREERERL